MAAARAEDSGWAVSPLRRNILANYAGQFWVAVMGLVFVPAYLRLLGVERFGIASLLVTVQALFFVLDLGMSGTLNREVARRRSQPDARQETADLVRSFEWLAWLLALAIALAGAGGAAIVARHWLAGGGHDVAEAASALALMALAVATQWPSSIYAAGLAGLERQVELNVLQAAIATLRYGGALFALHAFGATLDTFMWWHVGVGLAQTLVLGYALRRRLRPHGSASARFRAPLLREVSQFAFGVAALSLIGFALMQGDRVVLARALDPVAFGYYTLAATAAAALGRLCQPIFAAAYPRLSRLAAAGDDAALAATYHASTQALVVLAGAATCTLALFPEPAVFAWTGDAEAAARTAPVLVLLAAGTALNGLMHLPHALQLAHGRTRLLAVVNLCALVVVLPALAAFGAWRSGVGAAAIWLGLNVSYLAIIVPVMHRDLLPGQAARFYLVDVLAPLLGSLIVAALARMLLPAATERVAAIAQLLCVGVAACAAGLLCARELRAIARERLRAWRGHAP